MTLAFMAFSTVWGFGNVLNGFIYFNGIQVILSWVMMFVLYFIPYSLMVGELGSAFKNSGGGVNSWVYDTIGPKVGNYRTKISLLCRLDLLGMPYYVHCQQRKRKPESPQLGSIP